MSLVMIYAVLSNFDFVAKFTGQNLNKDCINAVRGGAGHRFMKVFHKKTVFFERWLPLGEQEDGIKPIEIKPTHLNNRGPIFVFQSTAVFVGCCS